MDHTAFFMPSIEGGTAVTAHEWVGEHIYMFHGILHTPRDWIVYEAWDRLVRRARDARDQKPANFPANPS